MPNNPRDVIAWTGDSNPELMNEPVTSNRSPGQLGHYVTIKVPTNTAPGASTPAGEYAGRERRFQFVNADSSMSIAPTPGAAAWWADKAAFKVTTDPATLGRGNIAGVFTTWVTKGNNCVIQTRGPRRVRFQSGPTATPTAAGLLVIPSATAEFADCLAAGTAATYPILGTSAGVYDSAAREATVMLTLPDYT